MSGLTGRGTSNPSRKTNSSSANGNRGKNSFRVQLTMSRIGNHTHSIISLMKMLYVYITIFEPDPKLNTCYSINMNESF